MTAHRGLGVGAGRRFGLGAVAHGGADERRAFGGEPVERGADLLDAAQGAPPRRNLRSNAAMVRARPGSSSSSEVPNTDAYTMPSPAMRRAPDAPSVPIPAPCSIQCCEARNGWASRDIGRARPRNGLECCLVGRKHVEARHYDVEQGIALVLSFGFLGMRLSTSSSTARRKAAKISALPAKASRTSTSGSFATFGYQAG